MSLGAVNGAVTLPIPLPPPIACALQVRLSSPPFQQDLPQAIFDTRVLVLMKCDFVNAQGGLLGNLLGAAGVKVDSADERRRITVDGAFAALLRP